MIDKSEDSSPFSARTVEVVSFKEAITEIQHHELKWRLYENEYILPCFRWTKEQGIDLEKLVRDNPGHNCVELLVKELISQK